MQREQCRKCKGTGVWGKRREQCPKCKGHGFYPPPGDETNGEPETP